LVEMENKLTQRHWNRMGEYAEQVREAFAAKSGAHKSELARLAEAEELEGRLSELGE
jgi:hypothetical protein